MYTMHSRVRLFDIKSGGRVCKQQTSHRDKALSIITDNLLLCTATQNVLFSPTIGSKPVVHNIGQLFKQAITDKTHLHLNYDRNRHIYI